ncbi:hypothetical protein [Leptothoe sp. PORK10 BA2]|jgi:hypothetical protein|uniref:hypothetical protein n=1 Tax=Leptothoe sp. PORK10 BA2 TaxID=3110254 RepID=UPI002B1EC6F2|nr:hypothetical protein [Leptothoe sp. PORK10 BA2]MEA5464976.1 hypothetical protein [Leptothoe sp. PORK10 BA2]
MEQNDFQQSLAIVIDVLQAKDITAIPKVKDFLYSLPSLKQIEQALAAALLHFAERDKSVFDWIVLYQDQFCPELDLFAFTRNVVRTRLCDKGWVQGRDFWFDLRNILHMSRALSVNFPDYFSSSELILVRTMLKIEVSVQGGTRE